MMIWEDRTLVGVFCAPKWVHVLVIGFLSYFCFEACYLSVLNWHRLHCLEIILAWLFAGYFVFLALSSFLLIIKGHEYVKQVKQLGTTFMIWNVRKDMAMFAQEEIHGVELVKYHLMDQVLIGFSKYKPGYNLYLKNGKKFFITAEMENLDTLKLALVGRNIV